MVTSLSLLLSLLAPSPGALRAIDRAQCDEPKWKSDPVVVSKMFRGTLTMQCTIVTAGDGDYRKLAETYVRATTEKETVHSGPTETTYENLPGVSFDVTLEVNDEGMNSVRTDTYIVGDGESHFVVAALSKEIDASGLAANVTRMDNTVRVARGSEPRSHVVNIETYTEVKKPLLIGVEGFKNIVMNQAETKMKAHGPETVAAVADAL